MLSTGQDDDDLKSLTIPFVVIDDEDSIFCVGSK